MHAKGSPFLPSKINLGLIKSPPLRELITHHGGGGQACLSGLALVMHWVMEKLYHLPSRKNKWDLCVWHMTHYVVVIIANLLPALESALYFSTLRMFFLPSLAVAGTRFLSGTRRSLHVFSSGSSHFMWRLKFSRKIERITFTMLVLFSQSLQV